MFLSNCGSIFMKPSPRRSLAYRSVNFVKWRVADIYCSLREKTFQVLATNELNARWKNRPAQTAHSLGGPLIVTLTSYPPRFQTLHLTLKCLLSQSLRPDRVILWIAHEDLSLLPNDVLDLRQDGLEIRGSTDLRSYKKIIPALAEFPDAYLVTADDDVYYGREWLSLLCEDVDRPNQIVCHRAHYIEYRPNGDIKPYAQWSLEARRSRAGGVVFPTGVGGVLYAPQALSPETINVTAFQDLCPFADDIWLAWMGRANGAEYRLVAKPWRQITWSKSQDLSLAKRNLIGEENDIAIAAMQRRYGPLAT
jgi:hypothetical protein